MSVRYRLEKIFDKSVKNLFLKVCQKYKILFYLNPVTFYVDYFRCLFFKVNQINLDYFYSSILIMVILFMLSSKIYKNTIGNVVDYV